MCQISFTFKRSKYSRYTVFENKCFWRFFLNFLYVFFNCVANSYLTNTLMHWYIYFLKYLGLIIIRFLNKVSINYSNITKGRAFTWENNKTTLFIRIWPRYVRASFKREIFLLKPFLLKKLEDNYKEQYARIERPKNIIPIFSHYY